MGKIFRRLHEWREGAFAGLCGADLRGLALLGTKARLARRVLEGGIPNQSYEGVVGFPAFRLDSLPGCVCDAAAVSLPVAAAELPSVLELNTLSMHGIWMHVGSREAMSWVHVDNLSAEDVLRAGESVRKVCDGKARGVARKRQN